MKTSNRTRAREGTTPRAAEQSEGQQLLSAAAERLVDVAERLHVGISTVSDWRRGAKSPGGHYRKRLAEVYGIPPESWDRPAQRVGGDRWQEDAEPVPVVELDTDGPPLEATLRHVDQVLANLMLPGATDEDRKQAESLRKILTTRAAMETKSSHVDAYLEKAMMDPDRQRYYIEHVEDVVEVLKREREVAQCGCMAAVAKMLAEREARRALGK
jgi:transcriptional regulator with XRE-family HTH domain